ncbi:hypothetical protein ASPTUDRAFT_42611, partial [Aspergillus tubingensis CBS 134.48]
MSLMIAVFLPGTISGSTAVITVLDPTARPSRLQLAATTEWSIPAQSSSSSSCLFVLCRLSLCQSAAVGFLPPSCLPTTTTIYLRYFASSPSTLYSSFFFYLPLGLTCMQPSAVHARPTVSTPGLVS